MADKKETQAQASGNDAATSGQQFSIQRIYVKDISFESPAAPQIFSQEWKPELALKINTTHSALSDDQYEVVLDLNVSVSNNQKTAFVVEIQQAGIFAMTGFSEENSDQALGCFCPSMLYPYAREAVTAAVSRGGFPQLVLAPINFEALYLQNKEKQKKDGQQGAA